MNRRVKASDLQEVQGALAETQAERQKLIAVMEAAHVGIILAEGPDVHVVYANPAARELYGSQDLLPLPLPERASYYRRPDETPYAPEDLPVARALLCGESVQGEEMLLHVPGEEERIVEVNAAPVPTPPGCPRQAVVTLHDITERKRLDEERERHAAELAEANEAKLLFFNALSHELRTPLAAILNAAEVMRRPDATADQQRHAREVVERNARLQARLVDDLLDLSRLTRGKVEMDRQPVDLRDVVQAGIEAFAPQAERAELRLRVESPEQPLVVAGDPMRLGQVLANLLSNAVKCTPSGGRITVLAYSEGNDAVLHVRDTGIGIAPDLLPRLFLPFVQADTTLARTSGGLGIGLSIVCSLVDLHGGRVVAESPGVGGGSTFTVRLPLSQSTAAPSEPSGTPVAAFRSRRILVLEDNPDQREMLALLLETSGHQVITARDGRAALELAARERPEIALLDIGLPDMDGYEVARRLRRMDAMAGTTLVALTGYSGEEHEHMARQAGFDAHLVKPVDLDALERLLNREPE